MTSATQSLSPGNQLLIEKIRAQIIAKGRAHMNDLWQHAAEQIRVLQSLDVIERVGDELRLVSK